VGAPFLLALAFECLVFALRSRQIHLLAKPRPAWRACPASQALEQTVNIVLSPIGDAGVTLAFQPDRKPT